MPWIFNVEIEIPKHASDSEQRHDGDTEQDFRSRVMVERLRPALEEMRRELGGHYMIRREGTRA